MAVTFLTGDTNSTSLSRSMTVSDQWLHCYVLLEFGSGYEVSDCSCVKSHT